ncbi:MAG: methylenetetrahydrofolate reductase [Alphaproteobacteria bacterium]
MPPAQKISKREVVAFLEGSSVETLPGSAGEISAYRELLAPGTRVYAACPPGSDYDRVIGTAVQLRAAGFEPVPHLPARSIANAEALDRHLGRLRDEAGVGEVLAIAGDLPTPVGDFDSTIQVLETGLLDRRGIRRIGVAGHPEGNPDIGEGGLAEAIASKNRFARETDAELYVITQFAFDAGAIIDWHRRIERQGNRLPVRIGFAGPANLRTLLRYAQRCRIGPSIRFLRRRALGPALLAGFSTPDELVGELARFVAAHPDCGITGAHFFTFGGVRRTAEWLSAVRSGDLEARADVARLRVL